MFIGQNVEFRHNSIPSADLSFAFSSFLLRIRILLGNAVSGPALGDHDSEIVSVHTPPQHIRVPLSRCPPLIL